MAAPDSLPALLDSLTQSLTSAQEVTPKIASIDHQEDGISLLDVKNELLFSYLQNLVFLILLKLRNAKDDSGRQSKELDEAVRSKLIELRLFLEKGARPLEEKLRFSIERFLSQARDSQSDAKKANGKAADSDSDSSSSSDSESEGDEEQDSADESVDDVPRTKPVASRSFKKTSGPQLAEMADDAAERSLDRPNGITPGADGVYRAPKRERHLMDTTASSRRDPKTSVRKPLKSSTMDEFIASELSGVPLAEPSIGTTIVDGGRKMKTASQRKDEDERREYEETNFMRFPKESKKAKAAKNKAEGRSGKLQFGGEEWHNLGEGVDRIDRLTKRKEGGKGANVRAMLDKSRKRGADTTDGPRGSGEMGERYQKRLKVLEGGRRDRGKGR